MHCNAENEFVNGMWQLGIINFRDSMDNVAYDSTTFLDIPEERKYNNLSVNTVNNWLFETVNVPPVKPGSRITVSASFDNVQGAFGLDNIHVYTQQK